MKDLKPAEIVNNLKRYPSFIDELKPYQLEMAEKYSQMMIQKAEGRKARRLEPYMKFDPEKTKEARQHASQPFDKEIEQYNTIVEMISIKRTEKRLNELENKIDKKDKLDQRVKYQPNDIEIQALDNVCRNAKKENKRDVLTEYLKLSKNSIKAKIRDLLLEKYEIPQKTFYKWTQDLDKEIKSISRTHE